MEKYFRNYWILILMITVFCVNTGFAQQIQGLVKNENQKPVYGATVILNNKQYDLTNDKGAFAFNIKEKAKEYQIKVKALGFKTYQQKIRIGSKNVQIVLKENTNELAAIVLNAKTHKELVEETGYSVEVINTKKLKNLNNDLNQVIKKTPGVNLRETGGLGSSFNLSLNGLSRNQIRYFINEVPMENFGSSLSLNNYSINLIESIEVYKGVVPVFLGADALGGAINIVTEQKKKSFLDASYSYGSFNTHRISFNGKYFNKKKNNYVKVTSFFNHSDNDYLMRDVPVFDELGNSKGFTDIKRFNDEYTSGMISSEFGVVDKKYVDMFHVRVTYAQNKNNRQHSDFNILRSFGDLHTENQTILVSSFIKKRVNKYSFKANVLAGTIKETINDTSTKRYNWLNQAFERASGDFMGELPQTRSLFTISDDIVTSQLYSAFKINKEHKLEVNFSQNYLRRKGSDKVNDLNRAFKTPSYIQKYITSLAYNYKIKLLEASVFVKNYNFSGKIVSQDPQNTILDKETKPKFQNSGYGAAFSFHASNKLAIKASYEKAYRLPESYEILGDGVFQNPNTSLNPEISDNLNLGILIKAGISLFKIRCNTNFFYRQSKDFIRLRLAGPFGNYENLVDVFSRGIESSIHLDYKDLAKWSTNITYQKITEENEFNEGQLNSNYKGNVPNIPSFFINTNVSLKLFPAKLQKRLTVYWNTNFVDEFFLAEENGGNRDDKNTIPTQLVHGMDVEYVFKNKKISISSSISNLSDAIVYDNFRIQKPRRAMSVKLRYSLQ